MFLLVVWLCDPPAYVHLHVPTPTLLLLLYDLNVTLS